MEQLRIIKEMRENDRRTGRSVNDIRPRYMVWENVPGAFSNNKGEDFRIVLEETAKVADKDASIPMPDKGKWSTAGCVMGNGWSIAWRILDAQFWGVPQRRRRIALVADFGGQSAPEILFVRKSVSGNTKPSQSKREETSSNATRSVGADDRKGEGFDGYNGTLTGQVSATLGVNCGLTTGRNGVIEGKAYTLKIRSGCEGGGKGALIQTEKSATLSTLQDQTLFQPVIFDARGNGDGKTSCYLTSRDEGSIGDYSNVVCYCIENHPADSRVNIDESGKVQTLTSRMGTGGGNVPMVMECFSKSKRAQSATDFETWKESDKANTLNAFDIGDVRTTERVVACGFDPSATRDVGQYFLEEKGNTLTNGTCPGHHNGVVVAYQDSVGALCARDYKGNNVVRVRYIVRRLTPMECERLQGYPDGWTDIGEYTDTNGKKRKSSDAARYKALGNSIAIPPWKWVMKRISACYERDATLASLFDGIGGFPYIWEQINGKGSCLWASEIEEFCIAVTKERIG